MGKTLYFEEGNTVFFVIKNAKRGIRLTICSFAFIFCSSSGLNLIRSDSNSQEEEDVQSKRDVSKSGRR